MATIIVTGGLYEDLDGQLGEIRRQVQQKGGYPYDPERLKMALQALIEGRFDDVESLPKFPCQRLAADLIPTYDNNRVTKQWAVVEDVEPTLSEGCALQFPTFLEVGETYVNGDTMLSRALARKANLGLVDAKFVLEHQDLIPVEMRSKYLLFAGTKLRSPYSNLCVVYLSWHGDRWRLRFSWFGYDFRDAFRLVARK